MSRSEPGGAPAATRRDRPAIGSVEPAPPPEVVAAIVAAVEAAWPRPVAATPPGREGPPPWRFSGRWWSRPIVQRRERPW